MSNAGLFFQLLGAGGLINSYNDLVSYMPPTKYASNPVITHDATYTNYAPASQIIDDPLDSSKFLFYVGEFPGNTRTNSRISLYTASKSDPFTLTRYGVVISQDATSTYRDQNGAGGICGVLNVSGTVYVYYTGIQGTGALSQAICLATSADGGRTFTKQGAVLIPNGTTEWNITDSDVHIFDGTWYMYYTAKSNLGTPLPTLGIRSATSSDGITWTRTGTTLVGLGTTRVSYDGLYIEGGQVIKIGSDYILLYTASSQSNVWSVGVAYSTSPSSVFTKATLPFFQHGSNGWDANSGTVGLLAKINNRWMFYYQGTAQFQPASIWDIGAAEITINSADAFPYGFLVNRGSWTGEIFFDTTNTLASSQDRVLRALDNTGFATAFAEIPTDITAGMNSSIYCIVRTNTATGSFRAGFYIYEGSTPITGIYFDSGNLKYLRSSGWTTLQAYSAGVSYTVEILLTSNSTITVNVNGSPVATGQPPFNNIVTKVNKIRLEKAQASTAIAYYADMKTNNLGAGYQFVDIGQ